MRERHRERERERGWERWCKVSGRRKMMMMMMRRGGRIHKNQENGV